MFFNKQVAKFMFTEAAWGYLCTCLTGKTGFLISISGHSYRECPADLYDALSSIVSFDAKKVLSDFNQDLYNRFRFSRNEFEDLADSVSYKFIRNDNDDSLSISCVYKFLFNAPQAELEDGTAIPKFLKRLRSIMSLINPNFDIT